MTPIEFAKKHGLEVASEGEISVIFPASNSVDLLSMVMGRAKEDSPSLPS